MTRSGDASTIAERLKLRTGTLPILADRADTGDPPRERVVSSRFSNRLRDGFIPRLGPGEFRAGRMDAAAGECGSASVDIAGEDA
ncbi:hypothetical protein GCM10023087_25270 [Microbacterium rhizosphaerae]